MRVFVTGASGWIGSAVVPDLLAAGHEVAGLARSDTSAAALDGAGVAVVHGDLDDLDVLQRAAAEADGVVHLAFKHDIAFSGGFAEAADADRAVVGALAGVLAGSDRPLVVASGVLGLAPGKVATEDDGLGLDEALAAPGGGPLTRMGTGQLTLSLAERGVRSSVLRLSPTVHGAGDGGFVANLVGIARATGVAAYVGDGDNRWPAVHVSDTAPLCRLALESAPAGSALHAVAEEGVAMRDIAAAIGRGVGVPVRGLSPDEAFEHFGGLGFAVSLDAPASSARTQELLGWTPTGPGLLEDLDTGHYFVSG